MKVVHHLKGLYYFALIARHLSIKQASAELHVTQAAVSQQLRLLEDALGVRLFRRIHRGIELTSEGQQLSPIAASAFDSLQRGVDGLVEDADPSVLTVSIIPSFASRWLIPRLGDFYRQQPDITVRLQTTDRLETFSDGSVDLGVRFGGGDYPGLESEWLMDDWMYPVAHPQYQLLTGIKQPEDLVRCQLLVDSDPDVTWQQWFDSQQLTISSPKYSMAYDASHYIVEGVLAGQGIGLLRHSLVAELVTSGSLVKLFSNNLLLDKRYFVCGPPHHFQRPKVKFFIKWLKEAVADFNQQNPLPQ